MDTQCDGTEFKNTKYIYYLYIQRETDRETERQREVDTLR